MKFNQLKKSFKNTFFAIALGSLAMGAIAISASESIEKHVMIMIDKSDGSNVKVDLNVNGLAEVFSLPELEVGQTETIITESGKEITISKTEKGLNVTIDGKDIKLPDFSGNLSAHIQRSMPLHHMMENNIQISGVELDDNQRQIIKNAFIAAGIDKKLSFSNVNFLVFTTGDSIDLSDQFVIQDGEHEFQWMSESNSEFKIIVKSDSNSSPKVKIHTQFIHLEESED